VVQDENGFENGFGVVIIDGMYLWNFLCHLLHLVRLLLERAFGTEFAFAKGIDGDEF
jgi:hypothetical protein